MTTQPADQSARDLISTTGLSQTLFVEAGAGTGKTTQLVNRIVSLVLDEGVPLANIAAITFTEAAAAELQTRIRVQFEKTANDAPNDEVREAARRALHDADLAAISTLHGFAARLLTEFSLAAGLPPQVRVVDEISSQLRHEERWQRFVDRLYDDVDHELLLVRSALVGIALEPRYQGQSSLKDLAAEMAQNWDRVEDLATAVPPPIEAVDFSPFENALVDLREMRAACTDLDDLLLAKIEEYLPRLDAIVAAPNDDLRLRMLVSHGDLKPGNIGKKGSWTCDVKEARGAIRAVNEAVSDVMGRCADELLGHHLVLIAQHVLEGADERKTEGGLEFHDLLVLARRMLRTNESARTSLHDRFSHLLLDEFQDTDPIQIELATLIAAAFEPGAEPGSWHEQAVVDGRLFFVGDPKQSIYRFRRADIGLFLTARDRFGSSAGPVRLTTNFRTVAPVLDWVNGLFSELMAEEIPGRQPLYEPLLAHRDADSGSDHRPLVLGGLHPNPKASAAEVRQAEADDVTRSIVDIATNKQNWLVFDRDSGAWREPRLSDITILIPTRTSMPFLRDALRDAEVNYRIATGTLVYSTQEILDVLATVRAIDDPTDEISLVTALRSPLFACSDVDLAQHRSAGGQWDIRKNELGIDGPVRNALTYLRGLWEERWWTSPSDLVDRILRDRRAVILAFADSKPEDVWRRLRFLVDQARQFEESGGSGLRAFVEWAGLQSADGARVHEPLLPETDDEAVQILTIHGSKGLEFPITILSGMSTGGGGRRSGVSVAWPESGPPEVRLRKNLETAGHEPRANLEEEMDEHEKLRLLYVASTRARDHLVVSAHHNQRAKKSFGRQMAEWAERSADGCRRLPETGPRMMPAPTEGPGTLALPETNDERNNWIDMRAKLLATGRRRRVMSATAVARAAADLDIDDDDDGADLENDQALVQRRKGRAGSAIGRAVHATLQVIDLADPPPLDPLIIEQCDLESIPDHVNVVAALVRSALGSRAIKLAGSYPHHKELFVSAPVGDRVIEGYVDLLVEGPDGLIVVDYKTDSARSEAEIDAKLAAYELQGASYAVALEVVTGLPVAECRFVFCRPSGAIERKVTDLPGSMQRVRDVLASDAGPTDVTQLELD